MRILAIGAHPDDCDLCFGGTAVLYARAGHQVKFISATNGDTGHYEIGGGQLARRRWAETQESCRVSDIAEYEVFDIHNNGLTTDIATRERFIKAIREWQPDLVFTHRTVDYHPDHRATAQLVQDSSYAVIIPNVAPLTPVLKRAPVICYFADRFRKPCPFQCDVAVDIDASVDTKLAMFRAQESQVFEWLAYTAGNIGDIPEDPAERDEWIRKETSLKRSYEMADRFRAQLIARYGEERGAAVQAAEGFEISEYGRQPREGELDELFPF